MARHPTKSEEFSDEENAFYELMAQKYTAKDSPEFERVVNILKQTIRIKDALSREVEPPDPDFDEAYESLSKELEPTLKLFETQNLTEFSKRWHFAKELSSQYNNFYSVPEWVVILDQFLEHQTQNEDSLLETGYPNKRFAMSPWLDRQLGCLYFVKFRYDGPAGPIWFRRTGLEMTRIGIESDYSNADYMKFLNPERAIRLDSPVFRKKVLNAKREVLTHLASCAGTSGPTRMGVEQALRIASQCLEKVNGHLTAEELHFLQETDENYGWVDNTDDLPKHINNDATLRPGGLADLLIVIGHVTGELALRFKTDVSIRLRERNIKKPRVGILFDLKAFYQDYARGSGQSFDGLFTRSEDRHKEFKQYLEVYGQYASQVLGASASEAKATEGKLVAHAPVVVAYPRYSQLGIDGKRDNYTNRVVQAVAFMIRSQEECLKIGREPMFDRVELCEHVKTPDGPSRRTAVRDILRGTPLEKSWKSLSAKNKYVLNIDVQGSRVNE